MTILFIFYPQSFPVPAIISSVPTSFSTDDSNHRKSQRLQEQISQYTSSHYCPICLPAFSLVTVEEMTVHLLEGETIEYLPAPFWILHLSFLSGQFPLGGGRQRLCKATWRREGDELIWVPWLLLVTDINQGQGQRGVHSDYPKAANCGEKVSVEVIEDELGFSALLLQR